MLCLHCDHEVPSFYLFLFIYLAAPAFSWSTWGLLFIVACGSLVAASGIQWPRWPVVKNPSTCQAGDASSIPGLGRSPEEGNGNPLQYSCLENPWTEEPGRVQSVGLQKSWKRFSDQATTRGI